MNAKLLSMLETLELFGFIENDKETSIEAAFARLDRIGGGTDYFYRGRFLEKKRSSAGGGAEGDFNNEDCITSSYHTGNALWYNFPNAIFRRDERNVDNEQCRQSHSVL